MDKLRALQYFVTAAEEGSLSAAARRFEVSVPAVAKLVTALEKSLAARLVSRAARGLTLTSDGETYLDACRPLLQELSLADERVSAAAERPRGLLTVGAPSFVAQHCVLPALLEFHARYPDIHVDVRLFGYASDVDPNAADLFVLAGWWDHPGMVQRRIAHSHFMVCAAPSYWAAHGIPQHPEELSRHVCALFRNPRGTILDVWRCERGGKEESVTVTGWLVSDHRDILLDAALAGEGVVRTSDLTIPAHVQGGRLVPVLVDWRFKDAPPISVLYRPSTRRNPRARVFMEFLTDFLRGREARRAADVKVKVAPEKPYWYRRGFARASSARPGERSRNSSTA
jgi:LysR family transcriptional regulator, regulator for bpeEF and oprC